MTAKITKCELFKELLLQELHKMPDKVDAVVNAPRATNVTHLRAYLGLLNYYHRCLPNLSTVVWPLNQVLEKGRKWWWTEQGERAFSETKCMVSSDQVLMHYDPQLPIKWECDASAYGIGAVLSHIMEDGTGRPIGVVSRSLISAEQTLTRKLLH